MHKGRNKVYAIGSNIISALGMNSDAHWQAVKTGVSGILRYEDEAFSNTSFFASKLSPAQMQVIHEYTSSGIMLSPFEQMAVYSGKQALQEVDIDLSETVLILSTTKGNIEWLGRVPDERILLQTSAKVIAGQLGLKAKPLVVSLACISGLAALVQGMYQLQAGKYKNAIVIGCDRFSRFVLSGFQSFLAVSDEPCRPFDISRKGITLGEASATIVLSIEEPESILGELVSGATTNDANHISGPSRTGDELALAIKRALKEAKLPPSEVDMIAAHGTATIYNDEMESKAIATSELIGTPIHSFKGYIGHTLGAAGVLESVMVLESMRYQHLIPSLGYAEPGVSQPLNITNHLQPAAINHVLKTASGFGGANAAIVWKRGN